MSAISVRGVDVFRGSSQILSDISFDAPEGELIALIGPNGSGKTTLLRAIAGLQPYTGTIEILGADIRSWKASDMARNLAFVRQALPLSFDFSGLEMVLLGRSPHKTLLQTFSKSDYDLVDRIMSDLDLSGMQDRSVLEMSGGERQRVLLAQALAQETDIILLDEPTTHLDIHHQYDFLSKVKKYSQDGKSVIAAIHDLQLAAQYADRIVVLNEGQIVSTGTPKGVLTTTMISSVFRVNADVASGANEKPVIQYNYAE